MHNFDEIEKLWNSHSVDTKISSDEMLVQVKKDVAILKGKSIGNIFLTLGASAALLLLWFYIDFTSFSTNIGLGVVIFSMLVYAGFLYRDHRLINSTDFTLYPAQYLQQLKKYQISRFNLYNYLYWFYAIGLSLGIALYFLEILQFFSVEWRWVAVLVTLAWIVFCSTFVRRVVIKREKERIDLLIEKFERLSNQFKTN